MHWVGVAGDTILSVWETSVKHQANVFSLSTFSVPFICPSCPSISYVHDEVDEEEFQMGSDRYGCELSVCVLDRIE